MDTYSFISQTRKTTGSNGYNINFLFLNIRNRDYNIVFSTNLVSSHKIKDNEWIKRDLLEIEAHLATSADFRSHNQSIR